MAAAAGVVLLLYVATALTASLWAPFDPGAVLVGRPLQPPSLAHLFGTDGVGRDIFSRVVYGCRPVLVMALSATGIAIVIGTTMGLLAGFLRGWFDQIVMRITDVFISVPPLVLALLIISALTNSTLVVVLTVAFIYVFRIARVVRAATLAVVTEDFVTYAVTRGDSVFSIIFVEILPNIIGTVLVEFAVRSGFAIVFIGALGFLGFGAPPPTPEWGVMINEGRTSMTVSLWPVIAPAAAMAVLVIALNLFTDGISRLIGDGTTVRRRA
ncbi:MAG TPA: ABC transporter permease [Bauldia sp.]|nr:ABC transporter permease [Bauldia sp.]